MKSILYQALANMTELHVSFAATGYFVYTA